MISILFCVYLDIEEGKHGNFEKLELGENSSSYLPL